MGTLYVVSTPIGNLEDITVRAIRTLLAVDVIASEDTRLTGQLLATLKSRYANLCEARATRQQLIRYDDQKEDVVSQELIELVESGSSVALVSDAGTPLLSDPGYRLISLAIQKNVPVVPIPGASSLLAALVGSGLPTQWVTFLGYLPEKSGHRNNVLTRIDAIGKIEPRTAGTYVILCSPHKLIRTLEDMKTVFGDIDIVIARELTKVHEEFWRGTLSAAVGYFSVPKGEFVLLFSLP